MTLEISNPFCFTATPRSVWLGERRFRLQAEIWSAADQTYAVPDPPRDEEAVATDGTNVLSVLLPPNGRLHELSSLGPP